MVAIADTAYPRLPSTVGTTELKRLFRLTRKERAWVAKLKISDAVLLDATVYLKCFQCLGYFPRPHQIPSAVVRFISAELKREPADSIASAQRSSHRIKRQIRQYCNVELLTSDAQKRWLFDFACQMGATKESPIDIINAMVEILIKESFELPGFTTLDDMARRARATTLQQLFSSISMNLSATAKAILKDLLTICDITGGDRRSAGHSRTEALPVRSRGARLPGRSHEAIAYPQA